MKQTEPALTALQSKTHFHVLDGLRGVAAFGVVIFHFMEFIVPDLKNNFIAHGYLAVDFFFCLSGFVIAYSYDNRMEKLGFWQFFKLRLIRLQPLVVIGSIIGLLAFVFDPFSDLYQKYGFNEAVIMFVCSCLMIPHAVITERYFNVFHLNPPTWSLFWEYIANIIYGIFLFKLNKRILQILAAIAAVILCYAAYQYKNLSVGWAGTNIMGGGARIFYSFLAGMLIYRYNLVIRSRLGFFTMALLLIASFLLPYNAEIDWITDSMVVLLFFPLVVSLGAGARLAAGLKQVCVFLGEISYPLYMVHYPFIWIFGSYLELKKPGINELILIMCVGTILLAVLAYLVMRFLDIPIRNNLRNRLKNAYKKKQAAVVAR